MKATAIAKRQRIKLAALANESFVMFSRDTTAAGHERVVQMCIAAGFYPQARYYVRQWLSAVALVSKGFGIALVPSSIAQAAMPHVRFVALDDPSRDLSSYLMWSPQSISPALEQLIAHARRPPAPRRATTRARPAE